MQNNQWLSRKQAAAFLNCHPDTITAIAQQMDKECPGGTSRSMSGRLFRIEKDALSRFMKERSRRGKPFLL